MSTILTIARTLSLAAIMLLAAPFTLMLVLAWLAYRLTPANSDDQLLAGKKEPVGARSLATLAARAEEAESVLVFSI